MTDGVQPEGLELRPNYGVMHVHTTFSDGGIDIEDAITAAREAELDFLFITDHNTIEGRSYEGYHGDLLVAVDVEVSPTPFWNHVIAIGLEEYDDLHRLKDPHQILDAIVAQGGVPWVPHPRGFLNPYCGVFNLPWRVWDSRVRGLELSTVCVEWVESLRPWNFLKVFRNPERYIKGPHPRLLRRWDQLNEHSSHPVSAYLGLDAHYRSVLGGRLETPRYEFLFRTNNLLAWTPARSGDAARDLKALRQALDAGEFVSLMGHVAGRRPLQTRVSNDGIAIEGVPLDRPVTSRLIHRGQVVAHQEEPSFRNLPAGRYRVEIDVQGRLWALTNPLDVKTRVSSLAEPAAATP